MYIFIFRPAQFILPSFFIEFDLVELLFELVAPLAEFFGAELVLVQAGDEAF